MHLEPSSQISNFIILNISRQYEKYKFRVMGEAKKN